MKELDDAGNVVIAGGLMDGLGAWTFLKSISKNDPLVKNNLIRQGRQGVVDRSRGASDVY